MKREKRRISSTAKRQLFGYGFLVLLLATLPFGIRFNENAEPFRGEAMELPRQVEELRVLIEQGSRATYADESLDTTKQVWYFIPAWEKALFGKMEIKRLYPKGLEGELEAGDKETWPGWAFYYEVRGDEIPSYCLADTRVVLIPDITLEQDQRSRIESSPREYVALAGNCKEYIDRFIAALE